MKINKILNATKKEIEDKKFNIFVGISLGNRYFSRENIQKYLFWALENTKEKVGILIADKIHSINLEVRNGYSKERALRVALKKGDEIENQISKIVNNLEKNQRAKICIIRWKDLESKKEYKEDIKNIFRFFEDNAIFQKEIMGIVKEVIKPKEVSGEKDKYWKLVKYPLLELPLFIKGFRHKRVFYNLVPYPGLSKIDYLARDISNGKRFVELNKRLNPKGEKCILVESYVD